MSPVEIRDCLRAVKKVADCPVLLTIRRASEGGYYAGLEVERLELFKFLLSDVDGIDVELSAAFVREQMVSLAKREKKLAVVSYHNFEKTPPLSRINEIMHDAIRAGADMAKIALRASTREEVRMLSLFTANFEEDILLTTISMGDIGTPSRVVNVFLGSCFTYGYVGDRPTTAGQIRVDDLRALINQFPNDRVTNSQEAEELVESAFESYEMAPVLV